MSRAVSEPQLPTGWLRAAADRAFAPLFLGAVLLASFWPTMLFGQTVASTADLGAIDALYAGAPPIADPLERVPPPLRPLARLPRHPALDPGIYDPAFYWIDLPNDLLQREYFARGEWPAWNPYVGLGTPLIGTGQSGALFPLKLIVYLLPALEAYSALLIARLAVAGLFAYAFSRTLGLSRWAALVMGTGYMLSGFMVMHFHNVEVATAAMLPLAMWSLERLAARRDAARIAAAGLGLGLLATAGHPTAALYAGAFAVFYFTARGGPRALPGLAAAGGIALCIAAPVALPFLERAGLGPRTPLTQIGAEPLHVALRTVALPLLLHTLSPIAEPVAQFNVYVGPLAIVLCAAALRAGHTGVWPLAAAGLASAALFVVTRGPRLFPVPATLNDVYNIPGLAFALAGLSGCGVDALRRAASARAAVRESLRPAVALVLVEAALWDLSRDADRVPGALSWAPLAGAAVLLGWSTGRAYVTRVSPRVSNTRATASEAVAVGAGMALFVAAAGVGVGTWTYGRVVGQTMYGDVRGSDGRIIGTWTARGALHDGVWRLNRPNPTGLGLDAELDLPPRDAGTLKWWDTERRIPLAGLIIDRSARTILFTADEETFEGRIAGGFHQLFPPRAARALVLELGGAGLLAAGAPLLFGMRALGPSIFAGAACVLALVVAARDAPQTYVGFPGSSSVTALQHALAGESGLQFRVAPIGRSVLIPNTNVAYGLRSPSLQDPVQSCSFQRFFGAITRPDRPPACGITHHTGLAEASRKGLELTGARFALLDARGGEEIQAAVAAEQGFSPSARDSGARVLELRDAPGRAWWVSAATLYPPDDPRVLAGVASSTFDPKERVLLEAGGEGALFPWGSVGPRCDPHQPDVARALTAEPDGPPADAQRGTVAVTADTGSTVRLEVSAPTAGFVVLADSDYPGWIALLGARPVPICRADGALRAVPVDAGSHTITFRYESPSVRLGIAAGAIGLAAVGLLLSWPLTLRVNRAALRDGGGWAAAAVWLAAVLVFARFGGFGP